MVAFLRVHPLHLVEHTRLSRCAMQSSERRSLTMQHGGKHTFDVASIGSMCIDINMEISQYPIEGGHHQRLLSPVRIEVAGSMNALIAASRLNARAAAVAFINSTGNASDLLLSNYTKNEAKRIGIDVSAMIAHPKGQVPTCAALFDEHGRHTFLATNEEPVDDDSKPSFEKLPQEMEAVVANSRAIIIDGYALHSDEELVRQCLDVALKAECEIWFDPQAATSSLLRNEDPLFQKILSSASGLSVTNEEAMKLTNEDYPVAVLDELKNICSATTILLKDGPAGSHALHRDRYFYQHGFDVEDTYADSIGAGDSFLGAFLACQSMNLTMKECLVIANAMGAATCTHHGAGIGGTGDFRDVEQLVTDFDAELMRKVNAATKPS